MPILTIGLPVYNAIPFLPESIHSILAQDYHDFNILVIDDGSTDGSAEYLKTVKDRRVRIVRQENMGLTFTLNRMLREADTPWLVRHDADDIAYPNRTTLIMEYIQKYPETGMFYSLADYYQGIKSFGTFRTTVASPEVLSNLTRVGYLLAICHPTVTLNIQKTLSVGGYRFNLHVEDVDLWWRMALHNDIVLIPEFTVGVRHNLSSVSSKSLERQSVNALYVQYLLISHLWGHSPLPYDKIKDKLAVMLDKRRLRFRENIRRANIYAGRREYIKACIYVAKSLMATPEHFLKRVTYELRSKEIAVNGVDPKIFATFSHLLWRERT
jgi:glycosyltransferase involved in cell wall biosynthesis